MRRRSFLLSPLALRAGSDYPAVRRGHCLAYDRTRKQLVLLGGHLDRSAEREEVWTFAKGVWSRGTAAGPAARALFGCAWHARRKSVVVFGGFFAADANRKLNDLWEWDGSTWRELAGPGGGTRDHFAMDYDAARNRLVAYGGGMGPNDLYRDTLEWDGVKWERFEVPGPGERVHHALAYDPRRKVTLLFGGFGRDWKYHPETWAWNGTGWCKVAEEGPKARSRARMAFDERRGVMVLYGGDSGNAAPRKFDVESDTWEFDGARWRRIDAPGPGPRFMHAMAWDGSRVVLHGGTPAATRDDTWAFDGVRWSEVR